MNHFQIVPLVVPRRSQDECPTLSKSRPNTCDKQERLSSASNQSVIFNPSVNSSPIVRAMGIKADEKDPAAVLRLLDFQLATTARPDQVARRLKAKNAPTTAAGSASYRLYTSKTASNRATLIDFPTPNPYFDRNAIYVLRNAFEIFKKDDVASDLIARIRARAEKAEGDAKLFPTLAASYLLWWNDDKDEALKEYTRATELARERRRAEAQPGRPQGPAGRAARGARGRRLGRAARPEDHAAPRAAGAPALGPGGDVERARKASERLFGLRLDADTQVQLATQMNQLGMHDLSEAVLARARRRSGGNAGALVSLMLQYQKQGKADVAVQVANQILRQTSGARQAQPGYRTTRATRPGPRPCGLRPVGQAQGADRSGRVAARDLAHLACSSSRPWSTTTRPTTSATR